MTAARLSPLYLAAAFGTAMALAGPAAGSEGIVARAAATAQTTVAASPAPIPRAAPLPRISARTANTHAVRRIAPLVAPPRRYARVPPAACTGLWCGPLAMLMLGIGF